MAVTFINRPQFLPMPASTGDRVRNTGARSATRERAASRASASPRSRRPAGLCWSDIEALLFAACAVLVIGFVVHSALVHTGPFATDPVIAKSVTVRVSAGDTIWSLSRKFPLPGISGEQRIAFVRSLNPNLNLSQPLQPGRRVVLPAAISP